jgi:hypothetical protein
MSVSVSTTNKPLNPRAQDLSPKGYNRAALYSGKALDFDGVNDVVTISDNAAVDFGTSDFSIAFTMNSSVAGFGRVLDKRSGTNGYTLSIGTSKELVLELNDGTGSSGFSTSSIYADGKLKHVVVSADRDGNASFYVNGVFDEAFDISSKSGNLDSTSDLFIGADAPSGNSLYYNGSIAGLKMYSTALTAEQVADLYLNPEKIVPDGVADSALKLWLPMMEGAGTTAYDGSGNGNHGTINGATWVSGIGAPVAQTALVSWNKGVNYLAYSENMVIGWTLQNLAASQNALEAPNGLRTATKFTSSAANTFHLDSYAYSAEAGIWKQSVFAKSGEVDFAFLVIRVNGGAARYGVKFDLTNGTFVDDITSGSPTNTGYEITDAGNGWYKCTIQASHTSGNITAVYGPNIAGNLVDVNGSHLGDGVSGMYMWGASLRPSTDSDSYVPTYATTQTSPVLLPQGLTANKDITGVNAFESARNPYALNLDGASWGEVHDNASVDLTTGLTLEAWVYWNPASSSFGILGKYDTTFDKRAYLLFKSTTTKATLNISENGTGTSAGVNSVDLTSDEWYHIVGTYDGANVRVYTNGIESNSTPSSVTLNTTDTNLDIGRFNNDNEYPDPIALPRIYNRALTATEVARNYNADKSKFGL